MFETHHRQYPTTGGNISIVVGESTLPAYWVYPDSGGKHPGIVFLPSEQGVTPTVRAWVRRIAEIGFIVLIPDFFNGSHAPTAADVAALRVGDSPVFSWGFTAAREALETNMRCTRKIGVVGWQLGGELAFQAVVKSPGLRAAVIISGNPQGALPILPQNETPLLAFYGDADEAISPPILNEFSAAIQDSPGRERMFVYPGVGGAFMDDTSPDYHEAYTAKTWTRMLEFLVTHLEATPRPVMAIIDEDGDEDDDDRNE